MTGHLTSVTGHFGELLQGRLGSAGPVALVTLPCPVVSAQALHRPGPGLRLSSVGAPVVHPTQLRGLARALGVRPSGHYTLSLDMPLGGGAGASTAALTALARHLAPDAPAYAVAAACLSVEGATDPLMFPRPERLLWASRRAQVLDNLPPLPPMDIIGGFHGPSQRTCPSDDRFPDIADLIEPLTNACAACDLRLLAEIATQSARRCLSLRGPANDPLEALLRRTRALGMVIAHTGSARGLIFAPGTAPEGMRTLLHDAGLRGVVTFRAGGAQ